MGNNTSQIGGATNTNFETVCAVQFHDQPIELYYPENTNLQRLSFITIPSSSIRHLDLSKIEIKSAETNARFAQKVVGNTESKSKLEEWSHMYKFATFFFLNGDENLFDYIFSPHEIEEEDYEEYLGDDENSEDLDSFMDGLYLPPKLNKGFFDIIPSAAE